MQSTAAVLKSFVESFGYPDKVLAHLTDNAVWTLHTGSQEPGGTYKGKQAITGLMNNVFGGVYQPESCVVDIQQLIADDNQASVRFTLSATTTWGAKYSNVYAIFVSINEDKIVECFEFLDSNAAVEQLAADAPAELST